MNRRQKSIGKNLALFAGILLAAGLFNAWIFHTNWDGYFRKDPVLDHGTIFKYDLGNIPVPDTIFFAGQPVPMTKKRFRKAVFKALKDRMKHRDATIFYLQQSARWLPEMSKILKEKQLPDDLKFIPIVESNLTNVTSARGAKGFWQLQTRTARNFGLMINGSMDQRLDPWASTEAAADYLKMLADGDWRVQHGHGGHSFENESAKGGRFLSIAVGCRNTSLFTEVNCLQIGDRIPAFVRLPHGSLEGETPSFRVFYDGFGVFGGRNRAEVSFGCGNG
jgi:hypothetical protein